LATRLGCGHDTSPPKRRTLTRIAARPGRGDSVADPTRRSRSWATRPRSGRRSRRSRRRPPDPGQGL